MKERIASHGTSVRHVVVLAGLLGAGLTSSIGTSPAPVSDTLAQREQGGPVTAAPAPRTQVATAAAAVAAASPAPDAHPVQIAFQSSPGASRLAPFNFRLKQYYAQIRSKLHWLPVRYAGEELKTPDAQSRLLLARTAAQHANLEQVGLSYKDVYGIINAETSWIPRKGSSKDGTPNLGIAQFEPATARAVGLTDPTDPVQAVHAAALQMRDAALWSARRLSGLKLSASQRAIKLREGVSIYYNLSTKGRNMWNGLNTAKLPVETRRHIANARVGAKEAAELAEQLAQLKARMNGPRTMTASSEGSRAQ